MPDGSRRWRKRFEQERGAHLCAAMGALEADEIRRDRERLAARVAEASASDLRSMGLQIVSLTLRDSPFGPAAAREERLPG